MQSKLSFSFIYLFEMLYCKNQKSLGGAIIIKKVKYYDHGMSPSKINFPGLGHWPLHVPIYGLFPELI